jgi:hypothetical protein
MRAKLSSLLPWLPALAFLPLVLLPPVNHDVAAVLGFSERWFAGERLYVDLIDINPPLIFVLNLLPAAIAAWTGLDSVRALQLCLLTLGMAQTALCHAVRHRDAEGPIERTLLDILPALFTLACGYDFGQRDVLMALLALPYLLAASRRAAGEKPACAMLAALMAGLGFALKPYFLAIPALVELAIIAFRHPRAGWTWLRDPTPWTLFALQLTYLAAIALFLPVFFTDIFPLAWNFYLVLGDQTPLGVLLVARMIPALWMLIPLIGLTLSKPHPLTLVFAAAALGALASVMAQHQGWSYHIVPLEFFTCALATLTAAHALDRIGAPRRAAAVLTGFFALYALAVGEAPRKQLDYPTSDAAELTALLRKTASHQRVLAFSPGIWPIYPALNDAHARLTVRTMNMWILEGAYRTCTPGAPRYRPIPDMSPPERLMHDSVIADFIADPPAAIIVDAYSGIPACDNVVFSHIDYFNRDPGFAAIWARYRPAGTAGHFTVYTK